MKTLVIPDIHHRWRTVEALLNKEKPYDEAIFLGDFFDSKGDEVSPRDAYYMAKWLKTSLDNPKHIHLFGNHDLSYAFPQNEAARCPGYTKAKLENIREIIKPSDWDKFKFFYIRQGWLLSHAGLSPTYLPPIWKETDANLTNIKSFLVRESSKCLDSLKYLLDQHWFFRIGDGRRKFPQGVTAGGLLWCDFDSEFTPIPGVSQIFGHSCHKLPVLARGDTGLDRINSIECLKLNISHKDGWNVALDCCSDFYGVIQDCVLQIKSS